MSVLPPPQTHVNAASLCVSAGPFVSVKRAFAFLLLRTVATHVLTPTRVGAKAEQVGRVSSVLGLAFGRVLVWKGACSQVQLVQSSQNTKSKQAKELPMIDSFQTETHVMLVERQKQANSFLASQRPRFNKDLAGRSVSMFETCSS